MIFLISVMAITLINLPFGYWRANVKKLSLQWFLAIHLPIPCVAYLRHYVGVNEVGLLLVTFLAAYFLGQYLGSSLSKELRRYGKVSSSLFHDLARRSWIIIIGR